MVIIFEKMLQKWPFPERASQANIHNSRWRHSTFSSSEFHQSCSLVSEFAAATISHFITHYSKEGTHLFRHFLDRLQSNFRQGLTCSLGPSLTVLLLKLLTVREDNKDILITYLLAKLLPRVTMVDIWPAFVCPRWTMAEIATLIRSWLKASMHEQLKCPLHPSRLDYHSPRGRFAITWPKLYHICHIVFGPVAGEYT